MYDLVDECAVALKELGYEKTVEGKYSLIKGEVNISSPSRAEESGFDEGEYIIYNCPLMHVYNVECQQYLVEELAKGLKKLARRHNLNKKSRILIVGLGNDQILADSLGAKVAQKIPLDVMKKPLRMFKFTPNIFFNTGINTYDMVQMLSIWLDVDGVVLIDALGTSSAERLTTSIQINDAGITPASAVNNFGKRISFSSLGVPCLSIGVPTMLLAGKVSKSLPEKLILTPKDIHSELDFLSQVISSAIIKAM